MIIFLDESGDLGFDFDKPKTSKKFVITLLVCEGYHATDSIRKKGTKTNLTIKKYFHRNLIQKGWQIYTVILNKLDSAKFSVRYFT